MLLNMYMIVYIGTVIFSFTTLSVNSKKFDQLVKNNNYKFLYKKITFKRIKDLLRTSLIIFIPFYNMAMSLYLVFDKNRIFNNLLNKKLENGTIFKNVVIPVQIVESEKETKVENALANLGQTSIEKQCITYLDNIQVMDIKSENFDDRYQKTLTKKHLR